MPSCPSPLRTLLAALLVTLSCAPTQAASSDASTAQENACRALLHVRGIPAPLLQTMVGQPDAFGVLQERVGLLVQTYPPAPAGSDLDALRPMVQRVQAQTASLVKLQSTVDQVRQALSDIAKSSPELLASAEDLVFGKMKDGQASLPELAASAQLLMLSQRIGKTAGEFMQYDHLSPEAVFMLGKDLQTFAELTKGLRDGHQELRLKPEKSAARRSTLLKLIQRFEPVTESGRQVMSQLQPLVTTVELRQTLLVDLQQLDRHLGSLCPLTNSKPRSR